MKFLFIILFCILSSSYGFTESMPNDERIFRLEATVEELTFKLAESLAENKRLSTALKQAMRAKREGLRVTQGCDTAELDKLYAYGGGSAVDSFIRENVETCSRDEVLHIYNKYGKGGKNITTGTSDRLLEYFENN
jgi:hypothetical protein